MPKCSHRNDLATGLSAILLVLLVAGCETSSSSDGASVASDVVDGVPTLTIGNLWANEWPAIPALTIDTIIGPSDGDALGLMAPLHAAILSDGRIVLGDVGMRRIWIGSDSGWVAGPGPGQGPGEMRSIGGVWPAGQGFIVHDPGTGDLVRFDSLGRWIDRERVGIERAIHGPGTSIGAWAPSVERIEDGNWLVAVPLVAEARADGPVRSVEAQYVWVSGHPAEGETSLGSGLLRPLFLQGGGGAPIPFGRTGYTAGAAGSAVVFRGHEAALERVGPDGSVTLRVQWTDRPGPLGPAHHGALGDFMRASAPSESPDVFEPMIATLREGIPFPERLPHLGALRLGEDGALWLGWPERSGLETPTEPELVAEWRIILPDEGTEKSQVFRGSLPPGVTLLAPAVESELARAPGWTGHIDRGAFFVLLRDDVGRQGIGLLRHGAGR
ncbi:MAG: hypothetical protein EA350_13535 [Gemmatimonadales bacterium]|nr:MAG: hypothetical protein EA350_13535 [Gemmatimonadales bacterium]